VVDLSKHDDSSFYLVLEKWIYQVDSLLSDRGLNQSLRIFAGVMIRYGVLVSEKLMDGLQFFLEEVNERVKPAEYRKNFQKQNVQRMVMPNVIPFVSENLPASGRLQVQFPVPEYFSKERKRRLGFIGLKKTYAAEFFGWIVTTNLLYIPERADQGDEQESCPGQINQEKGRGYIQKMAKGIMNQGKTPALLPAAVAYAEQAYRLTTFVKVQEIRQGDFDQGQEDGQNGHRQQVKTVILVKSFVSQETEIIAKQQAGYQDHFYQVGEDHGWGFLEDLICSSSSSSS
jgi:hypothetical protein